MIVVLWQISFLLCVVTLLVGLFKKSWLSMFISFITSLPIAYYFLGAENSWRLVALAPIFSLLLTFVFWRNKVR
ncbi:hypothetical protein LCL90_00960 [Bacillus infantis]|uniref:hypothetical protein n=1 Tax=Bacillus infantis TaxID=324767 RepID=UPI001CD47D28|nr:hypothetical protein [Bacillus infantis]MCA1033184.1 hypothetical protein [Bacillus infantis]